MKKLLIIVLVFICTMLVACGGESETPKTTKAEEIETTESAAPVETESSKLEAPTVPDNGESFVLTVATPQPAESAGGKVLQAACDEMNQQSNGRLEFQIYFSNQLVPVFDSLNAVKSGAVDIAFFPTSTHADYMPIHGNLLILPFIGYPGDDSIAEVYTKLCEEFPEIQNEFIAHGVTPLSTFYFVREDMYFTNKKKVETPADFAGLKVAISNAPVGRIVDSYGGAPVTTTQGDIYTNLSGGVTESVIHHTSFIKAGGCEELIKSVTMFGSTGLVREMGVYVISTPKMEKIPTVLQEIIVAGFQKVAAGTIAADNGLYNVVMDNLKNRGCEFTELTDDQVAPFAEAAKDVQQEVIKSVTNAGVKNAQSIFDRAREISEEYK